MEQNKWLIEVRPDEFDKAEGHLTVHDSGALIIRPSIWDVPSLVLAPGRWVSVVRDED